MKFQIFIGILGAAALGCGDNLPEPPAPDPGNTLPNGPVASCQNTCSSDALCTMVEDRPQCSCGGGFTGDGRLVGNGCSNINECSAGISSCDAFSTCNDTEGSFQCTTLIGFNQFSNTMVRVDPETLQVVAEIPTTVATPKGDLEGIKSNGLASHPDGRVFAILAIGPSRSLARFDVTTGKFHPIAEFADTVGSMSFADDVLYATTQDGSKRGATLNTVNLKTAELTQVMPLGNGNDGEAIFFHPVERVLYHFSGFGSRIVETINLETLETRLVASFRDFKEVSGVTWMPELGGMLAFSWSVPATYDSRGNFTELPAMSASVRHPIRTDVRVFHGIDRSEMGVGGGESITITGLSVGRSIDGGSEVRFGNRVASDVTVIDDNTITVMAPAGQGAGGVDIAVHRRGVVSHNYPGLFTYEGPPVDGDGSLVEGHGTAGVGEPSHTPPPSVLGIALETEASLSGAVAALAQDNGSRQRRGASLAAIIGEANPSDRFLLVGGNGSSLELTAQEITSSGMVIRENKRGQLRARDNAGRGLQDVREIRALR